MTKDKLKSVLQQYLEFANARWPDVGPLQLSEDLSRFLAGRLMWAERQQHFKFMCIEAQKFVDQDRIEKAMRWLGFLQGVLWKADLFTLDDLKHHSMP